MSDLEQTLYKTSLKNKEVFFQEALKNSLLGKIFYLIINLITRFISPIAKNSLAEKFSEMLTMISMFTLIFLSPFLSTDLNAVLVLFAVLATTLKHFLKPETIPSKADPLLLTVIAYFAISFIAIGFSPYLMAAFKGFSKNIIYLLCYLVFVANLDSIKNIRLVIWSLIISASIVALYGDYQFYIKVEPYQGALWDDPNATNFKTTRVYSFLKNPNLLAGYLIPSIAITGAFFWINSGLKRMIVLGSFFIQLACLYWTYSRGGWLGLIGILGTLVISFGLIFREKVFKTNLWKKVLLGGFVLGVLGFIAIYIKSPATVERFTSIFTTRGHSSNSFRMNVWISCFQMYKDNWLMGIGPGNTVFEKIYPLYMFSGFKALSAYNIFLETAIETGIVGLLIFLYMLFTHFCRSIWGLVSNLSFESKVLLAGTLSGLAGLCVQGMFDTVWYRPQVHIFFWFLIALVSVITKNEKEA